MYQKSAKIERMVSAIELENEQTGDIHQEGTVEQFGKSL
jgi:hypothetical protein